MKEIIKYYATIYVDELLEDEMLKHIDFSLLFKAKFSQISKQIDFTHAFLGLTKGKSPNELDEQDKELIQEKLKNIDWKDFDKKWYEAKEANEFIYEIKVEFKKIKWNLPKKHF